MIKRIIFILYIFQGILFSQTVTDIITLRENDSNGVPVGLGNTYTVSGIVTASNQLGNSGPGFLQDLTGGISVYASSFANSVQIGDSVIVTAALTNYYGLAELTPSSVSDIQVISTGHSISPEVVTISKIITQNWSSFEEYESKLIRINNVSIEGSGNFSGGTSGNNYTITDSTGSMEIRIDENVDIVGTSIPSSKFDIIGIVGQFKYSAPYNSGYQLYPRFIQDIVQGNEPLILSPIIPADITPNSFTVYFNTSREGNSEIKYGKTEDLELDSLIIEESTKNHKLQVNNLEESTTYYFQVLSTNEDGTSKSQILSVSTASSDTTTGTINVYFNYSVDNSVAFDDNLAQGNVNFQQKLIQRINSANYSLDIAVYSFYGQNNVANAIISAKENRGVLVRVVYDSKDLQSSMQLLADAGIKISQRKNTDGIMHNKFMIVDARDSIKNNDWVWTGSWNWNPLNNRNNVIEINDPNLASAYTTEFEEMWGSSDDTPTSSAKFGADKIDNTPHIFNIGGRTVSLYFSPSDGTESQISNAISTADTSIFFDILSFTSDPIFSSINTQYSNGVSDIRGIIDNVEDTGTEFYHLKSIAEVFDYNLSGLSHHKYGIIDSYSSTSDPIVITGSHNWSRSANEKNDENTLIIHDLKIANQYMQEFKARYNELGGTNNFEIPITVNVEESKQIPNKIVLFQNYPNPFNPTTTIRYAIAADTRYETLPTGRQVQDVKLIIYDILGRKVATLVNQKQNSGNYQITWNGLTSSGAKVPSGIYYYQLKYGDPSTSSGQVFVQTKKMILLK